MAVPKRDQLRPKVLKRFAITQKAVMEILQENASKISFTVDGWTSVANKSYYGITGHFIDAQWNIQSIVIDFVPSSGCHSGKAIAKLFHSTLKEYGLLDKVQGITLDNASANTTFLKELEPLMVSDGIDFDPINQHYRCFAHVINLAVNDMLRVVQSNVDEIEDTEEDDISSDDEDVSYDDGTRVLTKCKSLLKKIKYSEQWTRKLKSCCETTNCKMLSPNLGVATRWNSTCDMIHTALEMRQALNLLCENNVVLKTLLISENEWALLAEIIKFLRHFKVLSSALSGEKYSTLPMVIIGVNMMLDKLEDYLTTHHHSTYARSPINESVAAARDKLNKHYMKANWMYCVVLVLDPRHKIETFQRTSWGKDMANTSIQQFEHVYRTKYLDAQILGVSDCNVAAGRDVDEAAAIQDDLLDLNSLFESGSFGGAVTGDWRREFDDYLCFNRATSSENILTWWRQHEKRFPTLASMARDFLAIQATSVSVERFFSKASLVIRKHRNRLNDDSARSLLCLNSWVTCSLW